MTIDPALVAKALADRLADVEAARDRYAAFAFTDRPVSDSAPTPDDVEPAARDLVTRMLATVGDPVNDRIVHHLVERDATVSELAGVTGLPPLAVWERVNDLVQVGLARHALDGDRVGLTGAGQSIAELVADIAARIAEARRR